jgi:PAS domain S-box-containing protein
MPDAKSVSSLTPTRIAGRIALIYLALSVIWILASDHLLIFLTQDYQQVTNLQTGKGWFFVLVSAGLLFVLVRQALKSSQRAQAIMQRSEERYRLLADNTINIIWSLNLDLEFTYVNPVVQTLTGFTQEEWIGSRLADHCNEVVLVDIKKVIAKEMQMGPGGLGVVFETTVLHKNGETIPLEVHGKVVYDEVGNPMNLQGIAIDLAERKQAEKHLRERETFIQAVLDNLPVGIAVNSVDPEVKFEYMNDNFPKFYRTTKAALADPDQFWEVVYDDPTFRAQIKNQVLEDCASGDPERMYWQDVPITREGKETAFITARNTPIVDKNLMISTVWDVTERKQAEAERDRLLAAIEQTGEMIIITDSEGMIEYVNSSFERITGYSREEAIGQSPRFLSSGKQDEGFYRNLWDTISSGQIFQGRMVNKRKDGTLFTEEATISPVRDHSGRIVNYVSGKHDISEYLNLEAQFQQAQKMESVGRLAGGVAHDFNNMLSVIIGYAQMAKSKTGPNAYLHSALDEILKAANRSAGLIRQLLAFARKQTISPLVFDLNDTVENMLKMLGQIIGEDIDLLWQPGQISWPIKMDPSQLDQILANLCINARDAISGVGKITIETGQVTFDAAYCVDHPGFIPGDFVLLAVSDDGCGMDKETLANIFEPFFTTKEVNQGTGLGLAMVYGIVKQNNGFVNVYSEPGNGTTLKIYLVPQVGEVQKVTWEPLAETPKGRGETVLLVDDDKSLMTLGGKLLAELGYQALLANSPGEALQLAKQYPGKIHLLITDVVMPEMNGRDLANHLVHLYPNLKALYMSGYTANVIAHRGVLDEGVSFVQKPFSVEILAKKVIAVLNQDV